MCDVKRHHDSYINNVQQNTLVCTLFEELRSLALPLLFNTPKKISTQIKPPKKILAKFLYKNNLRIENFKPQKILQSSLSLETPLPPWRENPQAHVAKYKFQIQ